MQNINFHQKYFIHGMFHYIWLSLPQLLPPTLLSFHVRPGIPGVSAASFCSQGGKYITFLKTKFLFDMFYSFSLGVQAASCSSKRENSAQFIIFFFKVIFLGGQTSS